jgi:hypothetical protein
MDNHRAHSRRTSSEWCMFSYEEKSVQPRIFVQIETFRVSLHTTVLNVVVTMVSNIDDREALSSHKLNMY